MVQRTPAVAGRLLQSAGVTAMTSTGVRLRAVMVGPGRLGLGLIAALHDPNTVDMVVCGRRTSAVMKALERDLRYTCVEGGRARSVPVQGVVYLDDNEHFSALIRSNETRVVLLSVKDGQPMVVKQLRSALEGEPDPSLSPLIVVPCENVTSDQVKGLAGMRAVRRVIVCPSMVDRVCTSVEVDDVDGVRVQTEEYAEWCTSTPSSVCDYPDDESSLYTGIGTTPTDEIERVKDRKLFLMNFVQMNIAVLALDAGQQDIAKFIVGKGMFDSQLVSIYAAQSWALRYPEVPFDDVESWRLRYYERYEMKIRGANDARTFRWSGKRTRLKVCKFPVNAYTVWVRKTATPWRTASFEVGNPQIA